jgi:hypothetical protein
VGEVITTGKLCNSCDAEVFWALTENGRPMLVDASPCSDGNLQVVEHQGLVRSRVVRPDEAVGLTRYQSHFRSCPRARQHRKRTTKGA